MSQMLWKGSCVQISNRVANMSISYTRLKKNTHFLFINSHKLLPMVIKTQSVTVRAPA